MIRSHRLKSLRLIKAASCLLLLSCLITAQAKEVFLSSENINLWSWGMRKDNAHSIIGWYAQYSEAWWGCEVDKAGEYYLYMTVACPEERAGSKLQVKINGKEHDSFKVPSTGGEKDYKFLKVSDKPFKLKKGLNKIHFRVNKIKKKQVGNFTIGLLSKKSNLTALPDVKLYKNYGSFAKTVTGLRKDHPELENLSLFRLQYNALLRDYPFEMSWFLQDLSDSEKTRKVRIYDYPKDIAQYFRHDRTSKFEQGIITKVCSELKGNSKKKFTNLVKKAKKSKVKAGSIEWIDMYLQACKERRKQRLKPLLAKTDRIIFAKHQVFGTRNNIYNITEYEGLHDGEESELCELDLRPELKGERAKENVLLNADDGIIRDPDLSPDGKRLLFAWREISDHSSPYKEGEKGTNYQIFEMDLETKETRQLTSHENYGANTQPCYMPNGDIMFNSSRIVQHITCGWGDHSNLFLMNKDGKFQRRIGFDQVSTEFPTLLDNGQVIYLRRDYNDRAQVGAHALFVMNPDGTGQTEYYGNQTGTPTSFMHPRSIPSSSKIAVILGGYHTRQGGQLAIVDIKKGRNHSKGITMIPQGTQPATAAKGDDSYMKKGPQVAYPYPISEDGFIICRSEFWAKMKPKESKVEHYGIYFMTTDGRRELLAYDSDTSCLQPIPVIKRKNIPVRPSLVDYTKETGTYYIQNVYLGEGSKGIKPGTVKKIRVAGLLYKHDTIKAGTSQGPGGGNHTVTPPAHPLALFDAKQIIGEATVYEDGSAMFEVPARTPVYFQLLDDKNRCLQTMRSWTTLMPNEKFSCVGCHENKNQTPVGGGKKTIAMKKGVEKLKNFYGEPRGFSFLKEVQPIFDKHCVSCHKDGKDAGKKLLLTAEPFEDAPKFGRTYAQSYVQLMAARPGPHPEKFSVWDGPKSWNRRGKAKPDEPNKYVHYWTRLGTMAPIPAYYSGSIKSGMIKMLEKGHKDIDLPQEAWDKLVTWIDLNCPYSGDYMEGNIWADWEQDRYKKRIAERKRNEEIEATAIKKLIEAGQ